MNSSLRSSTLLSFAALLLVGAVLVAGCGGSDGDGSSVPDLIAALPEDDELGPGWDRITEPRSAEEAAASTLCEVDLNDGMIEGAKIDLADPADNGASMFFRRYESSDAAGAALQEAGDLIGRCPADALGPDVTFDVEILPAPGAGDEAIAAIFSIPETVETLGEEFGWTLVRTGDVVRSLQYTPSEVGSNVASDLDALARAVGATQ